MGTLFTKKMTICKRWNVYIISKSNKIYNRCMPHFLQLNISSSRS